jgi:hypothetical protein
LEQASERADGLTSVRATASISGTVKSESKSDLTFQLKPTSAMMLEMRPMSVNGQSIGSMSEILVGTHLYLRFPGLAEISGKSWVDFSLDDLDTLPGFPPHAMDSEVHQCDPDLNANHPIGERAS